MMTETELGRPIFKTSEKIRTLGRQSFKGWKIKDLVRNC